MSSMEPCEREEIDGATSWDLACRRRRRPLSATEVQRGSSLTRRAPAFGCCPRDPFTGARARAPAPRGHGRRRPCASGEHAEARVGSVRAFDSVPMEQAEKILLMTAKEAQAAETPPFQRRVPQSEPDAAPPSSAAQMTMLLDLANVKDSLLPKRTASLARFLHKRKQRVESAATMPYPHGEEVPTQMDAFTAAYARDKAPFGNMEHVHAYMEQPWASEDGSKSLKENHSEEAVNTELKM